MQITDEIRDLLVNSLRSFGKQELDSLLDDVMDLSQDQNETETTGRGTGRWSRKKRGLLSNMIFGDPKTTQQQLEDLTASGATFREPDFDPVSGGSRFTTFTRPNGGKGYLNSRGRIFDTSNLKPIGWRSG
jgi:hypothetical protein